MSTPIYIGMIIIITDYFEDFVTRSFEFPYLWFYKA